MEIIQELPQGGAFKSERPRTISNSLVFVIYRILHTLPDLPD